MPGQVDELVQRIRVSSAGWCCVNEDAKAEDGGSDPSATKPRRRLSETAIAELRGWRSTENGAEVFLRRRPGRGAAEKGAMPAKTGKVAG